MQRANQVIGRIDRVIKSAILGVDETLEYRYRKIGWAEDRIGKQDCRRNLRPIIVTVIHQSILDFHCEARLAQIRQTAY